MGEWLVGGQNTCIYQLSSQSYVGTAHVTPKVIIETTQIAHYRSPLTNIIKMRKSEILVELPKCDIETQSEQMLLKNWRQQQICSTKGCQKSSTCKKQNNL